jgi:hypothetical protein
MRMHPTQRSSTNNVIRRSLQRGPLTAALLCALASSFGHCATITVTSASESQVSGKCTLPEALNSANTNTATGSCAAGSGADTIAFATGVNDIVLTGGLFVTQALTLQGPAAGVTIRRDAAAVPFQVIIVDPDHTTIRCT